MLLWFSFFSPFLDNEFHGWKSFRSGDLGLSFDIFLRMKAPHLDLINNFFIRGETILNRNGMSMKTEPKI